MSSDFEQAKSRVCQSEGAYVTMRPLVSSWEQRKLGDVATIVGGGTPSTNNEAYWDGDIDWYSPAELGEQVYAGRSVRRITQAGYDSCSATLLPAGKTILFTSRAGIGNTAILRRSACTNQGFQSLVVNDDIDVYFVYSMTDRVKKFAEQKASGSTFLEISGKGLAAGEFAFPSKDEQTAIGSMFKQLDHLITLHQRQSNGKAYNIIILSRTKNRQLDIAKSAVLGLETRGNSRKLLNEHPIQQRFLDIP